MSQVVLQCKRWDQNESLQNSKHEDTSDCSPQPTMSEVKCAVWDSARKNDDKRLERVLRHLGGLSLEVLNSRNSDNCTALHQAVLGGSADVIRLLVDSGAEVDAHGHIFNSTPLSLAAQNSQIECIRTLLDLGADIENVDAENFTPLHRAAQWGSIATVELLLNEGADVHKLSLHLKEEPLGLALRNNRNLDIVEMLLAAGSLVNHGDANGMTPLLRAAKGGLTEHVRILLERSADVKQINSDGWTVLHLASKHGTVELVDVLLDSGCGEMVDLKTKQGLSCHDVAEGNKRGDRDAIRKRLAQ